MDIKKLRTQIEQKVNEQHKVFLQIEKLKPEHGCLGRDIKDAITQLTLDLFLKGAVYLFAERCLSESGLQGDNAWFYRLKMVHFENGELKETWSEQFCEHDHRNCHTLKYVYVISNAGSSSFAESLTGLFCQGIIPKSFEFVVFRDRVYKWTGQKYEDFLY